MKSTTLKKLGDGLQFRLSKKATGAIYELVRKEKGLVTISSVSSKRSYIKPQSTVVYPVN